MLQDFKLQLASYREAAPGWVDGVYYPRKEQLELYQGDFGTGAWKIDSRVWREIEETGFGIYYYEETIRFTTVLSGANYQVKVRMVNPTQEAYHCHIRVNGVLKEANVCVAPGETQEATFTACMTDGNFSLTICMGALDEIKEDVLEGAVWVEDITLSLEEEKQPRKIPRIFLVSDSTVQTYEKHFYPQTGWGQMLRDYFSGADAYKEYPAEHCDYAQGRTYELPEVVIENRSIGGRSARSFYDEGKLDQVLEVICPGDYMFVQFAHNDATAIRPNRYIAPEEFQIFLQRYVDACQRRKVQIVLVTPVTMRVLDEEGKKNIICFAAYRDEMIKLAKKENIPLLDLSKRSTDYLNGIGYEESQNLYLWFGEGEYPEGAYAGGVSDHCHLREYGARVYADMVVQMIMEYAQDDRLDGLKRLAAPVPIDSIAKPDTKKHPGSANAGGRVNGFVVQEISLDGDRANFLLNWNQVEDAACYHVYCRDDSEPTFHVVKTVTAKEKAASPVMPFTAEAGHLWRYYVTAAFENGSEGGASVVQEVDLR